MQNKCILFFMHLAVKWYQHYHKFWHKQIVGEYHLWKETGHFPKRENSDLPKQKDQKPVDVLLLESCKSYEHI